LPSLSLLLALYQKLSPNPQNQNRAFYLERLLKDLSKYSFTNRVVNIWNSLPNKVVLADSLNCYKSRLDKFWLNQDIVYNFRAEIEGTGKRSEV